MDSYALPTFILTALTAVFALFLFFFPDFSKLRTTLQKKSSDIKLSLNNPRIFNMAASSCDQTTGAFKKKLDSGYPAVD
jgi:hypothetical protein